MKIMNELYDPSGCPVEYTLKAETDKDRDRLNAIEQWLRCDDESFLKEQLQSQAPPAHGEGDD